MILTAIIIAKILLNDMPLKINAKSICIVIITIFLHAFVASALNGVLKTLLICVIYVIVYKSVFSITYSRAFILAFENILLMLIPDLLILFVSVYVLKIDTNIIYNVFAQTIISSTMVAIMLILLVYIFKRPLRKISNVKLTNNKEIAMYLMLSLLSILAVFYTEYSNVKNSTNNDLTLGIVVIVSFVMILYSLIKQKIENNKLMARYLKLLEFIKNYEKELDKQKELRHESKNQLITARDKIINKENEPELIKYLNSIIADYVRGKNEKYTSFQYLPANGIKGFFYYKASEAEDLGIKLSINVSPKIENNFLGDLNTQDFKQLGILLGVYLDNAIDASKKAENKQMSIEIYPVGEDVEIIISNTYEGTINVESIGKEKYSTKGKNHGYGLMLVNRILEENKRFEAHRVLTDVVYSQKLKIKKSINK